MFLFLYDPPDSKSNEGSDSSESWATKRLYPFFIPQHLLFTEKIKKKIVLDELSEAF